MNGKPLKQPLPSSGLSVTTRGWLLLDVSNLAYRSFYTVGDLSYEDTPTGVLFGVSRDILYLTDRFGTYRFVFCFDGDSSHRRKIYPHYKSGRSRKLAEMCDDEWEARYHLHKQIKRLRDEVLPAAGFNNVFECSGYEADDVIAMICKTYPDENKIIVSSDQDLFQLLDANTVIYNPMSKLVINEASFIQKYKIHPSKWARVKALAGCSSDDIPGVIGVGEITAIKFLNKELAKDTKAYRAINEFTGMVEIFYKLTKLPLKGCKKFELSDDCLTQEKWDKVAEGLGMNSLIGEFRL